MRMPRTLVCFPILLLGLVLLPLLGGCTADAGLEPTNLRCEYLVDPLAVATPTPRLCWELKTTDPAERGVEQSAYEIRVAKDPEFLQQAEGELLWTTGE